MVNLSFFLGILAVQGIEDGPPKKIPILLLSCLCMTTTLQSALKLRNAVLMHLSMIKVPPWQRPSLARAARYSQGGPRPPGSQPPPRGLELAASQRTPISISF